MLTSVVLCLIVGVADGDTLTARCGDPGAYSQERVRLAEIDAPEAGQPFGQRSKQHLSGLCFQQQARIEPTSRDRYGRTVARVECRGQDAGIAQVNAGMAWAFTRYLTDPAVARAQIEAQQARRGLWADPEPIPPWEWRRHQARQRQ